MQCRCAGLLGGSNRLRLHLGLLRTDSGRMQHDLCQSEIRPEELRQLRSRLHRVAEREAGRPRCHLPGRGVQRARVVVRGRFRPLFRAARRRLRGKPRRFKDVWLVYQDLRGSDPGLFFHDWLPGVQHQLHRNDGGRLRNQLRQSEDRHEELRNLRSRLHSATQCQTRCHGYHLPGRHLRRSGVRVHGGIRPLHDEG